MFLAIMIAHNPNLQIRLARDEQDFLAAQRLRYQVFVTELGGDGDLVDHDLQLEKDRFDPYFEHLVLVDQRRDAKSLDHVVGVYRMLSREGAAKAGQFYSESEYDLTLLKDSGRSLLELGRSCVHRDYRGGMAVFYLWNGLAEYVARNDIEVLFGVASFHGIDLTALSLPLTYLYKNHLAPKDLRVRVRDENYQSMDLLAQGNIARASAMKNTPALIKAYLRIGGYVGDGAFVDHAFNTVDVCLVLDTARMTPRQRRLYASEARS